MVGSTDVGDRKHYKSCNVKVQVSNYLEAGSSRISLLIIILSEV